MTIDLTQSELHLLHSTVHAYLEDHDDHEVPSGLEALLEKLPDSSSKPAHLPMQSTAVESL